VLENQRRLGARDIRIGIEVLHDKRPQIVGVPREALDLIVFAQAARAAGQLDALHEMDSIRKNMGFHDERLDALL